MNKTELAVKMVKDSSFKKSEALKVIEEFIEVVSGDERKPTQTILRSI
ncbi:MAG: hypothetical protein PVH61_14750 [Candidatus Aminicenantes bacterium]|jgi:hypothetical protein